MKIIVVLGILCVLLVGCDRAPPQPENGPGVVVDAPGVHVETSRGRGTEVEAPGVDIKTAPDR
jgi:hypothetical protein